MNSIKSAIRLGLLTILILMINPGFTNSDEQKSYDQLWTEIESLTAQGLPLSALQKLDAVQRKANAEKNGSQVLRSALYRFSLWQSFEEDHLIKSIDFAHQQLQQLQSPDRELMHSILAGLYTFYYQQNRQIILSRTDLSESISSDIREWDLARFRNTIAHHYESSIRAQARMDSVPLKTYSPILIKVPEEAFLTQPSLFDFVATRALDYYLSKDAGLQLVAPAAALSDERWWQPAAAFATLPPPRGDHSHHHAISLFQKLLASNLTMKNTYALIANELKRFEFLREYYSGPGATDSLYADALSRLQQRYSNHPASTEVAAQRAAFLIGKDHEKNDQSENRLALALAICENAIKAFPESRGAALCKIQLADILAKELSINIQRVELPGKAIPAFLSYRNVEKPAFRIAKVTSPELEAIMGIMDVEARTAALLKLPALHQWDIQLLAESDYSTHTTIIDIPALSSGLYVILTAESKDFDSEGIIAFASFQVSQLSFISVKGEDANRFFLLHRDSGKPVRNAEIRVMTRDYDYRTQRYTVNERMRIKPGRDGNFAIPHDAQIPRNQAFYIEAIQKNDTLYSDNYFDTYRYTAPRRTQIRSWFFTDRAIYRPGQIVYFKGITLEREGTDEWKIKEKHPTGVKLFDVNNRELGTLSLMTNSFGSFQGSFVLPSGLLNGMMRVANENGSAFIHVEEYKRPTFEVTLQPTGKQIKLGDSALIIGKALAYAGYGLDSSRVQYSIEREQFFPYWPWWRGWPPVVQRKTTIASGTTFTRKDGSFDIGFEASPDIRTKSESPAVYSYYVTAVVTDKKGEVQSGDFRLQIGEVSLLLSTNLSETVSRNQLESFRVSAENFQNLPVNTQVELNVYRFSPAASPYRPSLWPQTDRSYLGNEKLKELFPYDNFTENATHEQRPKQLIHSRQLFVVGTASLFPVEAAKWPQGEYLIEVKAKDEFGKEVLLGQSIVLTETSGRTLPTNDFFWSFLNKSTAEPGDTAVFSVGSALKGSQILVEVFSGNTLIYNRWHKSNGRKINVPLIVREEHRGQLTFQAVMVRHNRQIIASKNLEVPFTNKQLSIHLETKREKLVPGAKETWILSVKGHNKEKIAAELLASMYDASLDRFRMHQWSFQTIERKAMANSWQADNGFLTYGSQRLSPYWIDNVYVPPVYQVQLNWFDLQPGFSFRGNQLFGKALMSKAMPVNERAEIDMGMVLSDAQPMQEQQEKSAQSGKDAASLIRSDFRETAFFYPQLQTDAQGNLSFSFQLPDALTRWKLMMLAHTRKLESGLQTYHFTAAKDLMIVPNLARFYREGDTVWITAKVVNTGTEILSGIASLLISDALTGKSLSKLNNSLVKRPFLQLQPGQSQEVKWNIAIDGNTSLLSMRFSASAAQLTDAEEHVVPILPSGVLVTETMPMHLVGNSTKSFELKGLKERRPQEKTQHLSLQFTGNPVWYAIQALPYLQEGSSENSDRLFNRYYANALAAHIAQKIPGVMQVIKQWQKPGSEALLSNLEKNQSLKAVLLQETPWVLEASDETQQKRNIALLFDINRMQYEQDQALQKLREAQLPDGSWPWFPYMRGSRHVTLNILTGLGKLEQIAPNPQRNRALSAMITAAWSYLDKELTDDYRRMERDKTLSNYQISAHHVALLYGDSFYRGRVTNEEYQKVKAFMLQKIPAGWLSLPHGAQAMAAIVLHREGQNVQAAAILRSLRERALSDPLLGTWWKTDRNFAWNYSSIENHALLIAAFDEIASDTKMTDGLRTWLLSQKQNTRWQTNSATADAVHALLLKGTDWVSNYTAPTIRIGNQTLEFQTTEAGTGFVNRQWNAAEITPEMANVQVTNHNNGMAWGAMYRQYTVPASMVKSTQSNLRIHRGLFVQSDSKSGKTLIPLNNNPLRIGDIVRVRITIETDRDMEFVHLKDQRAAAFEPVETLSVYKFEFGLGYYQSMKDQSAEFFFQYLPKGKHVFEYSLKATQQGSFTHGFANIQSYYAPEFSAQSDGLRVNVTDTGKR